MNYISKQFAGPIIQGFSDAIENFFNKKFMLIINYFANLSIDLAKEQHTIMIGKLIGFPRPLIQKELLDATRFRFTVSYYREEDIGFAATYSSAGSTPGGILGEVQTAETLVYMDLPTYKSILKIIARTLYSNKRHALSVIDEVCKLVAKDKSYTIEWVDGNKNILITFIDLKVYSVYIIGYILNILYDTMPGIIVMKETTP